MKSSLEILRIYYRSKEAEEHENCHYRRRGWRNKSGCEAETGNPGDEIVIYTKGKDISYAGCGLPYYIGGAIETEGELIVNTPAKFMGLTGTTVHTQSEVVAVDPGAKTISVRRSGAEAYDAGRQGAGNGVTGGQEPGAEGNVTRRKAPGAGTDVSGAQAAATETVSYDKLVIAVGAESSVPPVEGTKLPGVFTVRTPQDAIGCRKYAEEQNCKRAVVVGGGFIGLELAENLRELGMEVTIVQRPKQLMSPFDPDMAAFLHAEARGHGVKLALGQTVEGFAEKDGGVDVIRKEGPPLHADTVVLAIGVTPDTGLAKEAGLELGLKDSIIVNDRMETSVPDIYAVGDAVQVKHYVTGQDAVISLAGPANKQGRIAADNICGGDSRYLGSQGSSVIKVFDLTAACTGVNESGARRAGLEVDAVILSPMSHAGYYPGGRLMTMKVVFEKETYRLLGAQIVGYEGVDKRIDVLATAIHAGLTVVQLKDLDLSYAPPYSSAKDPVNMAGFMAENLAGGRGKTIPAGGCGPPPTGWERDPAGRPHPPGVRTGTRRGLLEPSYRRAAPAAG